MRRREFITLLGGAAASWPLAARAQQGERMRRIGVLSALAADDPEDQARIAAFLQGLQELGWTDGRNVRIDYRWAGGDAERHASARGGIGRARAGCRPGHGTAAVEPLLQATRSVPIVFVQVTDPVGAGFVASLARPGGNATGFTLFEYGMSGKWLELLKQIAPRVTRAAVLRDPTSSAGIGQLAAMQAVAPSLGVEVSPIDVRDAAEIERAVAAFARAAEWRPDRDRGAVNGDLASRSDRRACGPAPIARGLPVPLLRRGRRPDVLWARCRSTSTGARPATSIASSRARSRPTCRCRRRPSTSW